MQAAEYLRREDARVAQTVLVCDDALVNLLLSNATRSILTSTMERAKSVEDISRFTGIPKSTCYEKVGQLLDSGIVRREGMMVTKTGMKFTLYRANMKSFQVKIGADGAEVAVIANGYESGHSQSVAGALLAKRADAIPCAEAAVSTRLSRG